MLYSVLQKNIMALIKSMCKGCSSLSKSDVMTFGALLKSAKQPPQTLVKQTGREGGTLFY